MSRFDTVRDWWANLGSRHDVIPNDIGERLPLSAIKRVTFFKRDELTTDLICCAVEAEKQVWFFHEEAEGWDGFLGYLAGLPGFKTDCYEVVVQPPFAPSETIAFVRA